MKVLAVVSGNPEEARNCGLGLGPLAREDATCERVQPTETLVDRLVLQRIPELLVLDADLEGFQAFQTVKTLRTFSAFMLLPIFVFSSKDRSQEAQAAGATQFLAKPVQIKDLEEALARHVKPLQRKAPRKSLKGPCVVTKGGLKLEARIADVSVGGAQVEVANPIPLGAMVQVGFALMIQSVPQVVRINARVVRQVPGGYGVAFSALDQQTRSLIAAYARS
jgi:CheY-like chemotaxis protein